MKKQLISLFYLIFIFSSDLYSGGERERGSSDSVPILPLPQKAFTSRELQVPPYRIRNIMTALHSMRTLLARSIPEEMEGEYGQICYQFAENVLGLYLTERQKIRLNSFPPEFKQKKLLGLDLITQIEFMNYEEEKQDTIIRNWHDSPRTNSGLPEDHELLTFLSKNSPRSQRKKVATTKVMKRDRRASIEFGPGFPKEGLGIIIKNKQGEKVVSPRRRGSVDSPSPLSPRHRSISTSSLPRIRGTEEKKIEGKK